jgi:hypothetical protein
LQRPTTSAPDGDCLRPWRPGVFLTAENRGTEDALPMAGTSNWAKWMVGAAVFLFALSIWATLAVAAQARTVYFQGERCSDTSFEPAEIILTCGDGKAKFRTGEWTTWDEESAHATGRFVHPECAPNVPLIGCTHYVEAEATVDLYRPIYCESIEQWVFSRLLMEDLTAPTPATQQFRATYRCAQFAARAPKPRRIFVGKGYARRLMWTALLRHPGLSFGPAYARRVRCNKRLSRDHLRCKMSWIVGDSSYRGAGAIWITYEQGGPHWNYSYRIKRLDEYCAFVEHRNHCTRTFVVR